jgi:aspartate/methionine/tyrosine aminotransferase
VLASSGLRYVDPKGPSLTAFVEVGDGDAVARAMERQGIGVARGSFFEAPSCIRLFLGAKPEPFARGVRALAAHLGGAAGGT